MPDTAATLNEAYGLIEQGELSRARALLQPLLETDSQNADVWWLYTHAAETDAEGQRALERVLTLDPQYPGAADLMTQLGGRVPARAVAPLKPITPLPASPATPTPTPVLVTPSASTRDKDDPFADQPIPQERRGLSRWLLVAGFVVLAIALLVLLSSLLNTPVTPVTPTAVADVSTPLAVGTAEVETPVVAATVEAVVTEAVVPTLDTAPTEEISVLATQAISALVTAEATLVATEAVTAAATEAAPQQTDTANPAGLATEAVSAQMTAAVTNTEIAPSATIAVTNTRSTATPAAAVSSATTAVEPAFPTLVVGTDAPRATTTESDLILPTEATQDPVNALVTALAGLNVPREDVQVVETTLGPTLLVRVCAAPVATATTALTTAFTALSENSAAFGDAAAVGVNLGCDDTRPRIIAAPATTAAAFGRGEIDLRTFRQDWQPTDLLAAGNG